MCNSSVFAFNRYTDRTASAYLLWIRDVTGISQDKGAKLVEVLDRPPPLVRRTEALKKHHRQQTLSFDVDKNKNSGTSAPISAIPRWPLPLPSRIV